MIQKPQDTHIGRNVKLDLLMSAERDQNFPALTEPISGQKEHIAKDSAA
jgi:hypothetical protein